MRKDFGTKSWFYPLPVLIIATYDEQGKADAMNAAFEPAHNGYHVLKERVGNAFSDGGRLK